MTPPLVLVTSAAGHTGSPAVGELIDRGLRVRALVRREDARSARLRARGAEVVVGSLDDPADVRRALSGAQRAYFAAPFLPGALRLASVFADAVEEERLEVVAVLSQWLADPLHPSVHTRETWLADRRFAALPETGVITVNPGWFADNYMAGLELAAQVGLFAMPLGEGRNAPPSNEDVARVVAGALADPAPHVGSSIRPTGPVLLSPGEVAEALGRALGRGVRYQDAPPALFSKVARTLGFPDYVTASVLAYFEDYRRDAFAVGAPTDAVERVGGRPAEDLETIARRYAASPGARRSLAGRLRAAWMLARVAAAPSLDQAAVDRVYGVENAGHAALAVDSPSWRAAHGADQAGGLHARGA